MGVGVLPGNFLSGTIAEVNERIAVVLRYVTVQVLEVGRFTAKGGTVGYYSAIVVGNT